MNIAAVDILVSEYYTYIGIYIIIYVWYIPVSMNSVTKNL